MNTRVKLQWNNDEKVHFFLKNIVLGKFGILKFADKSTKKGENHSVNPFFAT